MHPRPITRMSKRSVQLLDDYPRKSLEEPTVQESEDSGESTMNI